ncbi:MAG: hypothetical protein NE330_06920 [Lentisphaeraceae bacterium]|nr:hypothetical protein [Lentisphaeraceae bacterium]
MIDDTFKQGMVELYQGEIFGEVLFDQILSFFDEPELKNKISILLQLETETKARLRPAMIQLGLDVSENPESRKMGLGMAASMKGKTWLVMMEMIKEAVEPAIARYKAIADSAPEDYQELTNYMLSHETSMLEFAKLELAGKSAISIDIIHAQVENKFL